MIDKNVPHSARYFALSLCGSQYTTHKDHKNTPTWLESKNDCFCFDNRTIHKELEK